MKLELEKWMASAVRADGVVETDSVHIDQLDPTFEDRGTWKKGTITCLLAAYSICNADPSAMEIAAGASLADPPRSIGIQEATLDQLFDNGDWSAPNLYVFARGSPPWTLATLVRDFVEDVGRESFRIRVGEWFDRWEEKERGTFWVAVDRR